MLRTISRLISARRVAMATWAAAAVLAALTVVATAREPGAAAGPPAPVLAGVLLLEPAAPDLEDAPASVPEPDHEPVHEHGEGAVAAPPAGAAPAATASEGRFHLPLGEWSMVTDRYGAPRGPGLIHGGVDLALDGFWRSPVLAACNGTVAATPYSSAYGYHVIVDCGDGWSTLLGHLSQVYVRAGQEVASETVAGLSGSTGYSTSEHLHFEIRHDGVAVNPERYLDFKIAPGAPLSTGPIVFASNLKPAATLAPSATPTATPTPVTPTPTRPVQQAGAVAITATPTPRPGGPTNASGILTIPTPAPRGRR